jgi:hypothetical protein
MTVSALAFCAQASAAAPKPLPNFLSGHEFGKTPKRAKLLYNQNSNPDGGTVNSQNFTSGLFTSGDDAGADDFVVPKNSKWTVTGVDVTGVFFDGAGAATVNVTFYRDNRGLPSKAVRKGRFVALRSSSSDGSFAIELPGHGLALGSGTYWVSVVANCSYDAGCGQWGWATTGSIHGNQAAWEQPSSSVCPSWGSLDTCLGSDGDLMFDLQGIVKRH